MQGTQFSLQSIICNIGYKEYKLKLHMKNILGIIIEQINKERKFLNKNNKVKRKRNNKSLKNKMNLGKLNSKMKMISNKLNSKKMRVRSKKNSKQWKINKNNKISTKTRILIHKSNSVNKN